MKLTFAQTRFPEEIREATPFLIGCRGNRFAFLFDGDVDGYQRISRQAAEAIVMDATGLDISSFIKVAQYQDLIVKA
jgi:hypothetical protein